jgi:hypothetical protein
VTVFDVKTLWVEFGLGVPTDDQRTVFVLTAACTYCYGRDRASSRAIKAVPVAATVRVDDIALSPTTVEHIQASR